MENIKRYEIIWENDSLKLTRTNDGFNPIELLGILEITTESIKRQLLGEETSPIEVIKRKVDNQQP